MKLRSRLVAVALAGVTAIGVPVAVGSSAQAAVTGYTATVQYIGGGDYVNIRRAPSLSVGIAYQVRPGTGLSIECQTIGDRLGFSSYADNRTWDRLSDGNYVHDVLTTTPGGARSYPAGGGYVAYSSTIPQCGAPAPAVTRESKAVDFAKSQLGVSRTSLTPDGMWSGWCELLAEQAYGTRNQYASAATDYRTQLAQGRIHTDTNPPAGALVFYSWGTYGHVGISIGGGQVISTQGTTTPMPVRQHSVTGIGLPYLGWAYAPTAWPGR